MTCPSGADIHASLMKLPQKKSRARDNAVRKQKMYEKARSENANKEDSDSDNAEE